MNDRTTILGQSTEEHIAQLEQSLRLINDVLSVRSAAFTMAFDPSRADAAVGLYLAATESNDGDILQYIRAEIDEAEGHVRNLSAQLETQDLSGLIDLLNFARQAEHLNNCEMRLAALRRVEALAAANVALITSGEVCYPPALKSTVELMKARSELMAELEETQSQPDSGA